jgi:nitrous oxide reductase accessory protein NosL
MKLKITFLIIVVSVAFLAGCGRDTEDQDVQRRQDPDSELIRAEGTNVAALDADNDGMVYQCPMDYQVIANEMETCPVCKMDLEEYTVAEAQENLKSHYQEQ